jgi:hypothetical protein
MSVRNGFKEINDLVGRLGCVNSSHQAILLKGFNNWHSFLHVRVEAAIHSSQRSRDVTCQNNAPGFETLQDADAKQRRTVCE